MSQKSGRWQSWFGRKSTELGGRGKTVNRLHIRVTWGRTISSFETQWPPTIRWESKVHNFQKSFSTSAFCLFWLHVSLSQGSLLWPSEATVCLFALTRKPRPPVSDASLPCPSFTLFEYFFLSHLLSTFTSEVWTTLKAQLFPSGSSPWPPLAVSCASTPTLWKSPNSVCLWHL